MGMFDSVWIKCPHCDKRVEEQTKDGECLCSNYDLEDAPPVLKTAVSGYPIECYECGENFTVKAQVIATAHVYKTEELTDY